VSAPEATGIGWADNISANGSIELIALGSVDALQGPNPATMRATMLTHPIIVNLFMMILPRTENAELEDSSLLND
jgi:hypothetical protein